MQNNFCVDILDNMSKKDTILITEGNSGDIVSIENDLGALKVIKSMKGDLSRVENSINKQLDFTAIESNGILLSSIPLESITTQSDSIEIKMPHILGESGSAIQHNSSTTCSTNLKYALDKYFESLFESSKKSLIDTQIFIQKYNSILKNIDDKHLVEAIQEFEKFFNTKESKIEVIVGDCHGDLTLSNIISVGDRAFYLFDFLYTFLESPLQDVAKISQEFNYGWSTRESSKLEKIRASSFLHHGKPNVLINPYEKFGNSYKMIEILCLSRIAPYIDESDVITKEWLLKSLNILFYKLES